MNKITQIVLGALTIVALVVATMAFNHQPKVIEGSAGARGPQGERGLTGAQGERGMPGMDGRNGRDATPTFGAVSALDSVDSPYVKIGGLYRYYYNKAITASSSVFCSIQNPLNATSTLLDYHVNVTANGLGSQLFDVSTSSTAFASSSPAFVKNFSAGSGQFNAVWIANGTTTNALLIGTAQGAVGQSNVIVGPSEYVTAKISTSTAGTFATYYTGQCGGIFEKL